MPADRISESEYRTSMDIVGAAAQLLRGADLEGVLATIHRTDALGPILHPTQYRAKIDDLRAQRELAQAALEFHRVAERIREQLRPASGRAGEGASDGE